MTLGTNPPDESQAQSQKSFSDSQMRQIRDEALSVQYFGGRSLNAIWYADLSPHQKLILHFFGSDVNFEGTFVEFIPVTKDTISEFTGIPKQTLTDNLKVLVKRGFLKIIKNKDAYGADLPSEYALDKKLFDDYVEKLIAMRVERGLTVKAASVKRIIKHAISGRVRNLPPPGYEICPPPGTKSAPLFTPHSSPHKTKEEIKTPAQFSVSCQDVDPSLGRDPSKSARKPSASRGGLKEGVVSKSVLEGMLKGLFETTVGRDVIRALLHDMLKACPNREDLLEVIKEQEKTQSGLLIWTIRNRQALIHRAGIKVARE